MLAKVVIDALLVWRFNGHFESQDVLEIIFEAEFSINFKISYKTNFWKAWVGLKLC